MDIEIHHDEHGTLRFVAPGRGNIATLSHIDLSVLYGLARRRVRPAPPAESKSKLIRNLQELGTVLEAQTITVHMRTLKTAPGQLAANDLFPVINHLSRLNLVSTSTRRQTIGLIPLWPYAPVRITAEGRRLIDWLTHQWQGWGAYSQQFPL